MMTQAAVIQARGTARRRASPVMAGLCCVVLGLLMLAGAAYLRAQRVAAAEQATELRTQLQQAVARMAERKPAAGTALDVPLAYAHVADVETMVRIAKQQGIRLGALQFRPDATPQPPYVVRTAEFRIEEDYAQLKTFLAELLGRLPHMYLDELRVDQSAGAGNKVQATLRMSFVYHGGMEPETGAKKAP